MLKGMRAGIVLLVVGLLLAPQLRDVTAWWASRRWKADERVAGAQTRRAETVRRMFADAGVAYPPKVVLLRAFKSEGELEVWAGEDVLKRIATYEVCAASGALGPKRKEGDRQVPEGFYRITWFNPASKFHLSMLVNYPNKSDRILGDSKKPGGEIMVHGDCRSRGCLAMGDERIEELWVIAKAAKEKPHMHIFPTRKMDELVKAEPKSRHRVFWTQLRTGFDLFEKHRRLPTVEIDAAGRYRFTLPPAARQRGR
jgi:murein L,D-transpeptidase YafK